MGNHTHNASSLDTALNGVQGSSERLHAQIEIYKEALDRLTTSPFVAKMRALQDSIL
ncbi:MAG: hypothetical protein MJA84_07070 [Firmicutes bacterium]|nr:hypothetical protein [Bacillota bacterium]